MEAVINLLQKSNYISVFTSEPHFSEYFVKSVNSGTKIGIVSSTKNSAQLIFDQCTGNEFKNGSRGSGGKYENVENIGSLEDAFLHFAAGNKFNSDVLLINNCSYQRDIQLQLALLLKIWFVRFMEGELPRLIFIYRSEPNIFSGSGQSVQNQFTIQIENQRDTFDTYFDKDFSAGVVMDKDLLIEKVHTINHDNRVRKVIIVPSSDYTTSEDREQMAQENIFFVTEDEAVNMNFSPALNPNLHTLLDYVEDLQRLKRYEDLELVQNGDGKIIFIDTCMRNLTYSSLGGGIRFIDGIVGANYLQLINSVLKAHVNSSLYRLIDITSYNELEVVTKPCLTAYKNIIEYYKLPFSLTDHTELKVKFEPSLSYKPYVGKLATSLIQHSKDMHISREKQPIVSSVNGSGGVNGSVKKGKAKNKITDTKEINSEAKDKARNEEVHSVGMHSFVLALAAMVDSLNHNFVEYPSFEDENINKADFFVRHFMQYEGKDSLEIFAKLWNKIAWKETAEISEFETFVIDNFLNYSMIMEFYNIYNTLCALHDTTVNEAISEDEIREIRQILSTLLHDNKMTIVEDTLFSFICVTQDLNQSNSDEGKKYTIVKNLLFDDLKIGDTIYPLTREKDVIHTFIRS